MEIKQTQRGYTFVYGATAAELALLRAEFRLAELKAVTRPDGTTAQALYITDSPITVQRVLKQVEPVTLDWHDANAVEQFADAWLAFDAAQYLKRMASQLRREEREENVIASPAAHELAEKLSAGMICRDVVAWIKKQA